VVERVVPELVALVDGPPHHLWTRLHVSADDEEGRPRPVLAQQFEHGRRRLRRTVVEAEGQDPPRAEIFAESD
jgi:hypothetical protein